MKPMASTVTTWKRWKARYPTTLVLSTDTGYARDYSKDPYEGYYRSPLPFFGFKGTSPELPEKELVLGVEIDGKARAYPFSILRKVSPPLKDNISGKDILVYFDKDSEEAYATDGKGERIPSIVSYWFVWYSFHKDTTVYRGVK